jgi:PHAX RNA-binding domain
MATLLDEPNVELLAHVIEVLGPARAEALLDDTLRLAADGGVLVDNQSRRSTPGGVFFYLTRRTIPAASRRQIFPEAMAAPRLAPVPPYQWRDVNEMLGAPAPHPRGEATVKITLIGRRLVVEARGQAVMFQLKGSPPPSLLKGLPPSGVVT